MVGVPKAELFDDDNVLVQIVFPSDAFPKHCRFSPSRVVCRINFLGIGREILQLSNIALGPQKLGFGGEMGGKFLSSEEMSISLGILGSGGGV